MSDYEPTREQEKAIREYLHESIVPLIEQVLVKKLGQAMAYAAEQLVQPKREWVGLTDEEIEKAYKQAEQNEPYAGAVTRKGIAKAFEQLLKEKNT